MANVRFIRYRLPPAGPQHDGWPHDADALPFARAGPPLVWCVARETLVRIIGWGVKRHPGSGPQFKPLGL